MSQHLSLELNDELYVALTQQADRNGLALTEWLLLTLNQLSAPPQPASFLQTAQMLNLEGPIDWSTQAELYPEPNAHD
jgi:hypothetical protein